MWAVDTGGTKTHGVLADATGKVLTEQKGGPCNLFMQGEDGCYRVLADLLSATCAAARITSQQIDCAFVALGGLDTDADRRDFNKKMALIFAGTSIRWQLENDVLAALYSGTLGEPGIVLLAGTGSMAMGQAVDGSIYRCGGWGQLINGDPGSAYDTGRRLLAHVLHGHDANLVPDQLTLMAMAASGASSAAGVIDWVKNAESPSASVAALSKVVGHAAQEGNLIAQQLLKASAEAMVQHLGIVAARMGQMPQPVPVVLAGGMFRSSHYLATVEELLNNDTGCWKAVVPTMPPVGGSYVGALRLAGVPVTDDVLARFTSELVKSR